MRMEIDAVKARRWREENAEALATGRDRIKPAMRWVCR
jgi:post-segregation antitoxin (ccd killing protein)